MRTRKQISNNKNQLKISNGMTTQALKNISLRISSGGTPSRKRPEYFSVYEGHLWVKSKELLDSGISNTEEKITDEALNNSSAKYFPEHSVLIAMYGANVGQLGWLKNPATVNQAVCGLVIDPEKADWRYIFYALLQNRNDLTVQARGAAQQNLNQDLIKDFELSLLPIENQHSVADVLSAYDDLIENNTRRIQILEQMAQAIYTEWFVNFRFPGHEKAKMIDSDTDFGKIPEGWEIKGLGDIVYNFDSKRRPISKMKRLQIQGEIPYYGAAKVIDFVNEVLLEGKYLLLAEDGSVITKEGNPVLQFVNEKFWVSNHAHVLQGKDISTEHLYIALSRVQIQGYITGAAQPKITQENMNRIPVLVPDPNINSHFDDHIRPIFELEFNLENNIKNLRQTRDLLLPKLIAGEIKI